MQIDLTKLNYQEKIEIEEKIMMPQDYYGNTDIVDLSEILVSGLITLNADNYLIKLNVSGVMHLHDSITYDLVPYDFKIKIEETLEKSLKTLDLIEFLWHYIVLEIPLRYTLNEGSYPSGDNYRVISEEEYSKSNNPFNNFRIE